MRTLLGRLEACEHTTAPSTTEAADSTMAQDPSTTAADESKKKKVPVKFDVAVPYAEVSMIGDAPKWMVKGKCHQNG